MAIFPKQKEALKHAGKAQIYRNCPARSDHVIRELLRMVIVGYGD
jgi:hypothetical protein